MVKKTEFFGAGQVPPPEAQSPKINLIPKTEIQKAETQIFEEAQMETPETTAIDELPPINLEDFFAASDESFGSDFDEKFEAMRGSGEESAETEPAEPEIIDAQEFFSTEDADFEASFEDAFAQLSPDSAAAAPKAESTEKYGSFEIKLDGTIFDKPIKIPKVMSFNFIDKVYMIDMQKFVADNKEYLENLYRKNSEETTEELELDPNKPGVIKIDLDGQEFSFDLVDYQKKLPEYRKNLEIMLASPEYKADTLLIKEKNKEKAVLEKEISRRQRSGEDLGDLVLQFDNLKKEVDTLWEPYESLQNIVLNQPFSPAFAASNLLTLAIDQQRAWDEAVYEAEKAKREATLAESGKAESLEFTAEDLAEINLEDLLKSKK